MHEIKENFCGIIRILEIVLIIFKPPADYKPPKKNKKIFLPESDGSDNQYIGLVLGPKGVTQKALEGKTGCKISVRGKGSSKV